MKQWTAKVLAGISLLLAGLGVAAPLSIVFIWPLAQRLTAGPPIRFAISEDDLSSHLLTLSLAFLPTNIIALVLGIPARRSKLGKVALALSIVGVCLAVGSVIGALMMFIKLIIWPPPQTGLFFWGPP